MKNIPVKCSFIIKVPAKAARVNPKDRHVQVHAVQKRYGVIGFAGNTITCGESAGAGLQPVENPPIRKNVCLDRTGRII